MYDYRLCNYVSYRLLAAIHICMAVIYNYGCILFDTIWLYRYKLSRKLYDIIQDVLKKYTVAVYIVAMYLHNYMSIYSYIYNALYQHLYTAL